MDNAIPDCCMAGNVKLAVSEINICIFYNPPEGSKYRCTKEDFEAVLNGFPKSRQLLICGVVNFCKTNWDTLASSDKMDETIWMWNLLEQKNTHLMLKYIKSLNRNCNLPRSLIKNGVSSRSTVEKFNMLSHFFLSLFTPKEVFKIKDIELKEPLSTELITSKRNLRKILAASDIKKTSAKTRPTSTKFIPIDFRYDGRNLASNFQ